MARAILLILGLALLAYGGYRQFGNQGVAAADRARCEQQLRASGADAALIARRNDPAMVAATDARNGSTGAQAAAQQISDANRSQLNDQLIGWALIGVGLACLAGAALSGRGPRRV